MASEHFSAFLGVNILVLLIVWFNCPLGALDESSLGKDVFLLGSLGISITDTLWTMHGTDHIAGRSATSSTKRMALLVMHHQLTRVDQQM